ncbi:MAG: hypothetical protein NNA25_12370 [Nitrospira sp.]|nr:hypothetical protein [Nitrospira sp.]
MPIDAELLAILCCPETKQPLTAADDSLVRRLNDQIREGKIKNRAEQVISDSLSGGLLRADGKILYPIIDDIPVLLIEEGIPIDPLA